AYEESPEIMRLAMNLGWTRNVAILERCGSNEERAWYIRAALRFGWKKAKLLEAIESQAWLGNVNSKCEKNIKKYNQASRANSSRHSANTISEVFQPNISRG
uniref:DUF1016 N-terminal domain-containing protein n=1 Tax=Clostridium phoceensis TaxID=1650661 RepID=UPI0023F0E853